MVYGTLKSSGDIMFSLSRCLAFSSAGFRNGIDVVSNFVIILGQNGVSSLVSPNVLHFPRLFV